MRPSSERSAVTAPRVDPVLLEAVREDLLAKRTAGMGALAIAQALGKEGGLLGSDRVLEAAPTVQAHVSGFGPLEPLVEDPLVTDILVNGPQDVWVDRGRGLELAPTAFLDEDDLRGFAQRLISRGGRRVDEAHPCADVRTDGCRVHVVLPPLSTRGALISLRVSRPGHSGIESFLGDTERDLFVRELLDAMVAARRNFLVSGATGSGKTSLLSALLGRVSPGERLVIVEDASELAPSHPHVVSLQSREANADGHGEYTVADLLRQAMRMRPDRLIVGECRGAEVRELLAAMNTGHLGSGGTLHANSPSAVPARVIAMAALAGLSPEAAGLQLTSAVDILLHVERGPSGRRLTQIAVLSAEEGAPRAVPALSLSGGRWTRRDAFDEVSGLCGL